MRNIELKARCPDLAAAHDVARAIGAEFQWTRRQTDTYFHVPTGRLKLREERPGTATLVAYDRADAAEARECRYTLTPVADAPAALAALESQYGVRAQVAKTRALYLLENVRIHLDQVDGLGTFIEFEAVLGTGNGPDASRRLLDRLVAEFGIRPQDVLAESYVDLLIACNRLDSTGRVP